MATDGMPSQGAIEYPLFTDAQIVGPSGTGPGTPATAYGPYRLFNTIAAGNRTRPAIVLRMEEHRADQLDDDEGEDKDPLAWSRKTDISRYHGGELADEIAALVSLCLGVRAKSGGVSRLFEPDADDPRGRPFSLVYESDPVVPLARSTSLLPRALPPNTHNLDAMAPFAQLLSLTPEQAVALIRAARSYQEAMWIAEGTPEMSWLLFVSATETAAAQWRSEKDKPVERLRASRPEVERLLRERGGDDFVTQVAELLAPYMGATKTFVDFVMAFLPQAPAERAPDYSRFSWEPADMKKSLSKIYDYRSKALHGGIPFPAPMCETPWGVDGCYAETPGATYGARGAVWRKEDLPMLLHTFEYIVRHALLGWWRSMIGQAEQPRASESGHA